MDEVLDELGTNPEQAVALVNDYLEDSSKPDSAAFTSSIHAIKNRRDSMEDRHIIIHNLNKALGLNVSKLGLIDDLQRIFSFLSCSFSG